MSVIPSSVYRLNYDIKQKINNMKKTNFSNAEIKDIVDFAMNNKQFQKK